MKPVAQQSVRNDLAEAIAAAERKWTREVLEELAKEEMVEASWKEECELVGV